jgi:riboflavin biosynthesis pyrimidine reductase
MHVIWYTAMSMDGRIAGPDDDLSFLSHIKGDEEDAGSEFASFMSSIDGVIIGGSTMRWLLAHGESLPASGKPVWLVTRSSSLAAQVSALATDETPVHVVSGPLDPVVTAIADSGCSRLWVCGGGDVAGQLLAIDRIDEVVLTVAPVALGSGPALFDGGSLPDHEFTLQECRPYGNSARLVWVRSR